MNLLLQAGLRRGPSGLGGLEPSDGDVFSVPCVLS